MAFFKFRKGGDDQAAQAAPESIEALRKRARHRLLGAAVLVSAGVIGVPLVFDHQPRPIAVDIAIDIPDRNKVKPLTAPLLTTPTTAAAKTAPTPAPVPEPTRTSTPVAKAGSGTETIISASSPAATTVMPAAPSAPVPSSAAPVPAKKAVEGVKPEPKPDEQKATTHEERFVVQVGAFAESARAHETRVKLEKAGFKTYTQVVQTKDGERTRVRVGPFTSKTEVDVAAEKIKKLDLPATVLTL